VLLSLEEGSNLRFRCHTGHAYTLETLLADFNDKNEEALWNAVRALEETIMLLRRMADNVHAHGHESAAQVFRDNAAAAQARIDRLRDAILHDDKVKPGIAAKV
jgi:two-component system chemotaxis response regulator CheB